MQAEGSDKYILIVDDDTTMQLLLQGMVKKMGRKAVIAENGAKAMQLLDVGSENIGAVLLDRVMPDMDGMEVVQAIKENEATKYVPIIMQSGSNKNDDIRGAIQAGVFYYLTKPFKTEALQSVLDLAVQKADLIDFLKNHVKGFNPKNLIRSASFEIATMDEAKRLSVVLSGLFPEPFKVFPGVLALLINAIEHGNLELGYDDKAQFYEEGTYWSELEQREGLKTNKGKIVEIQFIQKKGRLALRITDQGMGFDWKAASEFSQEREKHMNGYGILKAVQAFDTLKYNTAGNQVMAEIITD